MIDFEGVWLPQIIRYAELVETGQLENEWFGLVPAQTSITNPNELSEQVFDDLDADNVWAEHRDKSKLSMEAVGAVDSFLAALRDMPETDARSVVSSEAWGKARIAARQLTGAARKS